MATDPKVSLRKFTREIEQFRSNEKRFRQKGIWVLRAEFPLVYAVFAANSQPVTFVPFGASIDFSDYDAQPPSIRLVHPITEKPLSYLEILPQNYENNLIRIGKVEGGLQELAQGYAGEDAFLCLPGVREYHNNPAHTGDSWWLHRGTGEGTLNYILETLWRYGVKDISSLTVQVQITGLNVSIPGFSMVTSK